MMPMLIILTPLLLLIIWALVFDLRRRRRRVRVDLHDAHRAVRDAKGKGTSWM